MRPDDATSWVAYGCTRCTYREPDPLEGHAGLRIWLLVAGLTYTAVASAADVVNPSASQTPPDANRGKPVLELRFEGNLTDTSDSQRVCTSRGAISYVEGHQGQCASLDGRNWIDTGLLQKDLDDEFTVECWVNPGQQQSPHADIFGNHVSEGSGFVLQQESSATNQFYVAYGVGAGKWVVTESVSLAAGRWQHVALVKTRDELRFYLNGVLVADARIPHPSVHLRCRWPSVWVTRLRNVASRD